MESLPSCSCGGFVPARASACPHCGATVTGRVAKVAKAILGVAAGGSVAVTLMACYGPPPRSMEDTRPPIPPSSADVPRAAPDAAAPSTPVSR
ncbi:MAG: hypothetical protein JNL38_09425 [Myxococcales bacterium]|jgi:pyruvate/2-oxoacid:ferredoxin oxidoreductase beta subunit|nr:hypothetical protein [Myxococcales bacterium]